MAVSRKKADPENAAEADAPERAVAYVAGVGRKLDGSPNEVEPWKLLAVEGASDDDKRAAWNHPDGELPPEDRIHYVPRPQV
jgi:hypothetical protein